MHLVSFYELPSLNHFSASGCPLASKAKGRYEPSSNLNGGSSSAASRLGYDVGLMSPDEAEAADGGIGGSIGGGGGSPAKKMKCSISDGSVDGELSPDEKVGRTAGGVELILGSVQLICNCSQLKSFLTNDNTVVVYTPLHSSVSYRLLISQENRRSGNTSTTTAHSSKSSSQLNTYFESLRYIFITIFSPP